MADKRKRGAVHVIVVTHNSEQVLALCLASLAEQTLPPASCIVVDSGSDNPDRHREICRKSKVVSQFLIEQNIGFAAANNRGFSCVLQETAEDIVLFLNPDCFPEKESFEKITHLFTQNPRAGAIGGTLLGYDLGGLRPSGLVDSTGIFRRWYGRWYDRDQGQSWQQRQSEQPPALCGAMMACRYKALLQLDMGRRVFDERFFLYKEDIELSHNLVRHGWQLWYFPQIQAYHCRGWSQRRSEMPYNLRLMAAENEIRLYDKYPSPYILWAVVKYLLVRFFRV